MFVSRMKVTLLISLSPLAFFFFARGREKRLLFFGQTLVLIFVFVALITVAAEHTEVRQRGH